MITFLFWNLNNKPLQSSIANLVAQQNIDLVILAECTFKAETLLSELRQKNIPDFYYAPSIVPTKIEIYSRFSNTFLQPVYDDDRVTMRHLKLPDVQPILLVAAHLPSKLYLSEDSQNSNLIELAYQIRRQEHEVGHTRTILIGDLNVNPFETGVVVANGLHGVMSRTIAQKEVHTVQSKTYPFFYNPMWNLFGDRTLGPPGTYYYGKSAEPKLFFWNMFDQVLLRPELLPFFDDNDLEILTTDGKHSLSSKGLPSNDYSDHYPILFKLSFGMRIEGGK